MRSPLHHDAHARRLEGRFLFLDGLRGLAALAVGFFHFANHWVSPIHDRLDALLPPVVMGVLERLDLGIEIFFVLSGFVIAHSLWGHAITPRYAANFVVRRSIRLDPPYWVMIAVAVWWTHLVLPTLSNVFREVGGWRGVLINMFYLPDLVPVIPAQDKWVRVVGVAWTLCLEVQFYLAFLLLIAASQGIRFTIGRASPHASRYVVAVMWTALAAWSVTRWFSASDDHLRNVFVGRWFMFFSGALLYATAARAVPWWMVIAWTLLLATLSAVTRDPHSAVTAGSLAVIGLAVWSGGLRTWLGSAPFQYLGRLSYSFYLVHLPVGIAAIKVVVRFGDRSNTNVVTAYVVALLASLIAADVLYRVVERPAMLLSARLKPPSRTQSLYAKE